jgi:hypothetical protein
VDQDLLAVNTIRGLCIDAVQKANSGHPGTPMGMAPVAYTLRQKKFGRCVARAALISSGVSPAWTREHKLFTELAATSNTLKATAQT